MKTKKQVLAEHPDYATLINLITRKIGKDSVKEVNGHGATGGFSGFIYTRETAAFFKRYKKDILSLLRDTADGRGKLSWKWSEGLTVSNITIMKRNNGYPRDRRILEGLFTVQSRMILWLMHWHGSHLKKCATGSRTKTF